MKEENYIPSLSGSYTAGAYYSMLAHQEIILLSAFSAHQLPERPQAFGSLIYGGFDRSRLAMNNITFLLTVNLLPGGAVYAFIDFAEPQKWLPRSACDAFEKASNLTHLTYDSNTGLYLVDAVTRGRFLEQNPSISFGLGPTAALAERVNIVLTYGAFDQQATIRFIQT